MSKNRIKAVLYDESSFPLAPSLETYSVLEYDDHLLFIANGVNAQQDFATVFQDGEKGYLPTFPDGDYVVKARVLNGPDRHKVEFLFINIQTKEIALIHNLDAHNYLVSYARAFNDAAERFPHVAAEQFELAYSVAYLKKAFDGIISGNDAFWTHLYRDLDVATAPLNLLISREVNDEPSKPIRVQTDKPKSLLN